jgi:GT2 family glycosyltransferase
MYCSVVIPCLGRADLTRACIASLRAQTGGHELEIVLVDNQNDPATQALASVTERVRVLVQTRNLGFAGACNRGLAAATAPFVLVLNNDTQAAPSMLTRLHRALGGDDRIGFAAPISNRVKGDARVAVGELGATVEGRERLERELCQPCDGLVQDVDSLSGLCLLALRSTWQRLSGFDERFMPGNFEDDDLCLRARLLGLRLVIARDAYLHHEAHQSFRALGIDVHQEIRRQHAVFAKKWQRDPAGRAVLASMTNDLGAAALAAMAAQRLHPAWPDADWWLARWHCQHGQWAQARPLLQALLARCPLHSGAVTQLGLCHLHLDQAPQARKLWRWALSACWFPLDQACDLLVHLGEHSQRQGDLDAAAMDFATALSLKPGDATLLNRLGAVRVEQRRFEEALPLLEEAASKGVALAHTNLGICHYQRGDGTRALAHFAKAAQQLPDDATAQSNYEKARAASAR